MRNYILIAALVLACGDDTATPPVDEPPPAPEVDAASAVFTPPVNTYGTAPGPARDGGYPLPQYVCWTECYLGPCGLQCGEGEVPTENVNGAGWRITVCCCGCARICPNIQAMNPVLVPSGMSGT